MEGSALTETNKSSPSVVPAMAMSALNEDVLLHVLVFLPTLSDLSALARTCKRLWKLWQSPVHSEALLKHMHRTYFGSTSSNSISNSNSNSNSNSLALNQQVQVREGHWKQYWVHLYKLRRGLILSSRKNNESKSRTKMCSLVQLFAHEKKDANATNDIMRTTGFSSSPAQSRIRRATLGVLTPREESEAILYDNPASAPYTNVQYCCGYFGMMPFHCTGSSITIQKTPIVVWGDFPGVRIFDALQDVLYAPSPVAHNPNDIGLEPSSKIATTSRDGTSSSSEGERPVFTSVMAANDGGGPVLAVLACPPPKNSGGSLLEGMPCLFLGFASGMVMSICARISPSSDDDSGGSSCEYTKISAVTPHTDEVTVLAFVPYSGTTTDLEMTMMLVSAGVDGKVFLYPYALLSRQNYALDNPVLVIEHKLGIFSIAATRVSLGDNDASPAVVVVCTGDQHGNITLWEKQTQCNVRGEPICSHASSSVTSLDGDQNQQPQVIWNESDYFVQAQAYAASTHSGSMVTRMAFAHGTVLITGSNFGDVRFWDLQMMVREEEDSSHRVPRLTLRHGICSAHDGTVEVVEVCGNVALTSGGNDGMIKGWDLSKGTMMGAIPCHVGKPLHSLLLDTQDRAKRGKKKMLKSSVVGAIFQNESLVCICRDGTLHTWDYSSIGHVNDTREKEVPVQKAKWNCHRCTFLNEPNKRKCRTCGSGRKRTARELEQHKHGSKPSAISLPLKQDLASTINNLSDSNVFVSNHPPNV
eukprot:scaffold27859_cov55-Attheya_sp.AAC.8